MGRRDEPSSSGRNLRPRNNVDYIKEEIISDEEDDGNQYIPPVTTRSGRRLRAQQDIPESPPSTNSPPSPPESSLNSYEKSRPAKRRCVRNAGYSSAEPSPKKSKKDIKIEEPDEEPFGAYNGISDDSFLVVPENLKSESARNLHPLDYRDRITAVLRMYKSGSLGEGKSNGTPFLNRNLFFIKGSQNRDVPEYEMGTEQPPLVWTYPAKITKKKLSSAEKKVKIMDIINVLPNMKKLQKTIASNHGIRDFRFGAGTIAMAGSSGKYALTNDVQYRNFLKKQGRDLPQKVLFNYPVIKDLHNKAHSIMMTPSVSRDSSLAQSNVYYYSAVFKSIRHNLTAGERIAGVSVLLVEQVDNHFTRPKRVPAAVFKMNVNSPATTIFIDLPKREPKKGLTVHLLLKVDLSTNQNECSVEGHSLRNTASRLSIRSPEEERRTSPRKSFGSAERPKSLSWEQTFYGTAIVYKDPSLRGPEGYIQGDVSILLVDKSDIGMSTQAQDFIPTLQDISKKMHSNPFVQVSIGKFSLDDMDSEVQCLVRKEPLERPIRQERQSPRPETEESEEDSDKEPLKTALDIYTGRFKWDPKGTYVNDRETLKFLFREDIFKDQRKITAIRKWIPLRIPKKVVYRILCKAELRSDAEPKPMSESYPCELPVAMDYDLKCANMLQTAKGNQCIICKKLFANMFTLMLHYHTSYPRLSFLFQLGDRSIKQSDSTKDEVRIDVLLDPHYMEAPEACFFPTPIKRMTNNPFYLTTRCQSQALRSLMRMDLTLFCRFIKLPEVIDDTTVVKSRFVDTNCGRQMRQAETYRMNPKSLPQPSFSNLVKAMNETVLDYIDIDEKTKRYMCTWNKMTLAIGRGNQNKAGVYMTHRLFLILFGEHMREKQQLERFICQVVDQVEKGALSGDEQYDLITRLYNREYDPLADPNSSLYIELMAYAKKQYQKCCQAVANAKQPKSQGAIRRTFLRCYRSDPTKLEEAKDKTKLLRNILYTTDAIPKGDPRRYFVTTPFKFIFNGHIHEVFNDMPPV